MIFKKAKRFLAGVCVFSMLFTSIDPGALTVMAAENMALEATDVDRRNASEAKPATNEDAKDVTMPFGEQEESATPASGTIMASGTIDGGEILVGEDWKLNQTTGVLTFDADKVFISDNEFQYTSADAKDENSFKKKIKSIRVENGGVLKIIGEYAFAGLPNLESIDLSNCSKLTEIRQYAFKGCKPVREILLPDELQTIESSAFSGCEGIKTLTLTPGLTNVAGSAFSDCINLSTVIVKVDNLTCGGSIFKGCAISDIQFASNNTMVPAKLFSGATFAEGARIVIPNHIQEIGAEAFSSCTTLVSVTFENTEDKPSALASIAKSAFSGCKELESVEFPNSVKVIEESAYANCSTLKKLVIPNTVTTLGKSAFANCSGVSELTISNAISSLGASVFEGCSSLTEVEIPSGLTEISASMFKKCANLRKIKIPTSVKSVGNSAFEECGSLPTIVLPDSVEKVGNSVFNKCYLLDNPTMPKDLTVYGSNLFSDCLSLSIISTSEQVGDPKKGLVIPEKVEQIGGKAFSNCDSITNLTISKNVNKIDGGAFGTCEIIGTVKFETLGITCGSGIFEACLLEEVIFPEESTAIPANLFSKGGFRAGTIVTIPKTVTTIGRNAFGGTSGVATNVSRIVFEEGSQLTTIEDSAFTYCTAITEFVIPITVTKIGNSAFLGCKKLQEITIPENITSIGSSAFKNCEVMTTVKYNAVNSTAGTASASGNRKVGPFENCNIHTILLGEKVEVLPSYLFCGAKFSTNAAQPEMILITLKIPASVGEIGEYAFSNISNLSKVYFAEESKLRSVGTYAFNECTALTECNLPDTVTTIGNAAFRGCVKLAKMDIPSSLKNLGNYAFYQCGLIKGYRIPAAVTGIGDNTFFGNTALESMTFDGYDITAIGASAYEECENLKKIIIPSGTTSIGDYAFKSDTALEEVTIPSSVSKIGTEAFKGCDNAKFYVVSGSYAEKWLKDNGFTSQIICMHTITYELNGGDNDIRNIGGFRDGDTFTFYEATKPGYSFDGWYLDEAFTEPVKDLTGRTGDFKLYAKWKEGNYTITYELYGGENHPDNPTNYTFKDAFTFQKPTRVGYRFNAWYTDSEFKKTIKEIKEGSWGNLTLYAKWTPNKYTVKFDGKSTNATVSKKSMSVTFDSVYGDLPTATREGYQFDGWYTEDNVLITKDTIVSIAENHTLYAKWVLDIRVQKPTADIESGTILEKGTKVILSTKTPGAYIYYTLTTFEAEEGTNDGKDDTSDGNDKNSGTADGGDKTRNVLAGKVLGTSIGGEGGKFILYTEPIEITDNTIIRAYAVKEGYKDSDVVEFVYKVVNEKTRWGDIIEKDRTLFKDGSEVPEGIWVAGVKDTVYTGKAIKFNVRVYNHKTLLTEKKDYTIKYSNNTKVAFESDKKAPAVTITAKGNYKGKQTVKFNILPRDISGEEFEADDMWGAIGKLQKPVPVLTWGKTKLKNKRDFTVDSASAMGYSAGGTYTVTMTGRGNYCGTRTVQFTLTNMPLMSKAKVTGVKAVAYTGKEITPDVTVTHSGSALTKGTDYEVEYRNNVEVGTATIVITGKGGYAGIKKVTFKINPVATLSKVKFIPNQVTYTGSAIRLNEGENPLKFTATYKGMSLTEGKDYVVESYSNNIAAGKGTVVFRGINSYSGTVKKTFKINAYDIGGLKLKFVGEDGKVVNGAASCAYRKGGAKPSVYLEYEGKVLKAGKDYTLSYKSNTKLGTATITVKGKKNFKGTLKGSFTVTKQDIGKVKINVPDVPFRNAANIYVSKPVLTDLDGKKLAPGKDYSTSVTYAYAVDCYVKQGNKDIFREEGDPIDPKDILPKGTMIKATVYGAGNYTEKIEGVYRIVEETIAKAKVTVTPQEYTGKAVMPGKDQIKVMVGGKELSSKDYEIVGYSNNTAKGNATITLRGTGEYGGTITVKFKIIERKFIVSKIFALLGF